MKKIVENLRSQGHEITYSKRKDGSIRITSIDSIKFEANKSRGNAMARAMMGETLSERKQAQTGRQLRGIAKRQGRKRRNRKAPLPESIRRELRKAQSAIRKATKGGSSTGTVSAKTIRKIIAEEGEEAALRKLERATRYFKGYAYPENVDALASYVEKLANDADNKSRGAGAPLRKAKRAILRKRMEFLETWIKSCHEVLYDLVNELRQQPKTEWRRLIEGAANAIFAIIGA